MELGNASIERYRQPRHEKYIKDEAGRGAQSNAALAAAASPSAGTIPVPLAIAQVRR
jgi:hypothetical protein